MAEQTYRIVIENRAQSDPTPVSTNETQEQSSPNGEPITKKKTDSKKNNDFIKALVSVNTIKPYIMQAASFYVSQIEMETGSASTQRKAQAYAGIVASAGSIVSAGISGGPYAAAAAAAITALQTVIQTGINEANIANQKRLEQENIALRKSRLGMSVNRSRGGGTV
jgi:hypothetical protein